MDLGYGPGGLSIILACNSVPALLIILCGVAGDRFRRQPVLIAAEIITSIAWLALALCFWRRQAPLPLLCALAALSGIATAMFLPTIRGIVADLLSGKGRLAGNVLITKKAGIGGVLVAARTASLVRLDHE